MRAVIYLRISLDATGERAGVQRQLAACEALCVARGWDVVEVVEDNSVSASRGRGTRPGWEHVLSLIELERVDVVVAWHFDRITRSMVDLEDVIQLAETTGVGIAFAEGQLDLTTPSGRLNARILAAVARDEIERKGVRQRAAYEQKALDGRPHWTRRPFGYELDGSVRQSEALKLVQAYKDVLAGRSVTSVAREWNEKGIRTTVGGQWATGPVKQLLLNPRNAGIRTHRGEEVGPGQWPAIVDINTFRLAEKMLNIRAGDPRWKFSGRRSRLGGIIRCEACGAKMARGTKNGYAIYACTSKAAGKGEGKGCQTQRADWLDEYVTGVVREALKRGVGVDLWKQQDDVDLGAIHTELNLIEGKLKGLAEDYALDLMTREQLTAATETLRKRRGALQDQLTQELPGEGPLDPAAWESEWENLSEEQLQRILRRVVTSVWCTPRGRGARSRGALYDPSKIRIEWRSA